MIVKLRIELLVGRIGTMRLRMMTMMVCRGEEGGRDGVMLGRGEEGVRVGVVVGLTREYRMLL